MIQLHSQRGVAIDLGAALSVKEYTLQTHPISNISWLDWTLQGSPDGRNWTLLDTQVGFDLGRARQLHDVHIAGLCRLPFLALEYHQEQLPYGGVHSGNIGLWGFQNLDPVRVRVSPNNMTANNAPSPFVASSQSIYALHASGVLLFQRHPRRLLGGGR